MNKAQHISNNDVLGAPSGWDQKELPCGALAITRQTINDVPVVLSYWKPTALELEALNAGYFVQLAVVGQTMPPVSLDVRK